MSKQFNVRLEDETIGKINAITPKLKCTQADVIRQGVNCLESALQKKNRKKKATKGDRSSFQ
jgi:hypothetical protein